MASTKGNKIDERSFKSPQPSCRDESPSDYDFGGNATSGPPDFAELGLGGNPGDVVIKHESPESSIILAKNRNIPEGAEIIDLDSISDDSVIHHPATDSSFIKSKDQNTSMQHRATMKANSLEPLIRGADSPEVIEVLNSLNQALQPPSPKYESASDEASLKAKLELGEGTTGGFLKRLQPGYGVAPVDDEGDENAWMQQNEDFDGDAAETFADLKSEFKKRKRSGKVDWQDEINFLKAKNAENARLKRLKTDGARDINSDQLSDDDLFISSAHQEMTENSEDRERSKTLQHEPEKSNGDKSTTESGIEKERVNEEFSAMAAGIEEYWAKTEKQKLKSKRKQDGRKSVGKARKAPRKPKNYKSKSKMLKPRPNQPGCLNDIGSLLNSNVYEDMNANLDRPHANLDLAASTHKNKDKLLKELVAAVPLEEQKETRGQRSHILKATKILGKVRADGKGNWKMKGMKTSLFHHQVQGAAWMREREDGVVEPRGGLQADQMGLGKTLMMIATMIANRPSSEDPKPTLIVCTPAILTQWRAELNQHAEKGVFRSTLRYQASTVISVFGPDYESTLNETDIILTTYQEVMKSYPQFKPPKEMVLPEQKKAWWEQTYKAERGPLHKIYFYRIVLDEAQAIKNHMSQTSMACRGLMSKHRWAISGTPIQNAVAEIYPFFKFLRVKHTGSLETFKENFCEPGDEDDQARLHLMLKQFMIRRTHVDRIFGKPIVVLPKTTQTTLKIEFNMVERHIYETLRIRYIKRINSYSKAGTLEKSYGNVLTMLLRLRQLTAHPFMLQETIEDLFEIEDIENLWKLTAGEVSAEKDSRKDMLLMMREIIAEKENPSPSVPNNASTRLDDMEKEDDQHVNLKPLVFKFRKFLRELANGSKWEALMERSLCHRCRDSPDDPWVTDCMHVYCKECLNTMAYEAAKNGAEGANCQECGKPFSESGPCTSLAELGMGPNLASEETIRRKRKSAGDDMKWIDTQNGSILPSSKTTAVQAQIEKWFQVEPEKKVIIFCQFHQLIKILEKVCDQQGWKHCSLHGRMTHDARDKSVAQFRIDPDLKIMIASLKCGGVGLNLTMASRVICVDLWWNSSVEQQAFCRVFRIGQDSETFITRLIVKNTVDEKLQNMQDKKDVAINGAIDNPSILEKRSLPELMQLFGPVIESEGQKPFIMVEDEGEYDGPYPLNLDDANQSGLPFKRS